jgi:hypothetical protein
LEVKKGIAKMISLILPDLVLFRESNGYFPDFLEEVYSYFKKDFIDTKPSFQGVRLGLKKHPILDGKEYTFWHIISEGQEESERKPCIDRMERIRWPKPMIENSLNKCIKLWKNKRGRDTRILIWYEDLDYIVILCERKGYILPWTAYLVKESNRKRRLNKEYESYIKAKTAQKL